MRALGCPELQRALESSATAAMLFITTQYAYFRNRYDHLGQVARGAD